jgi:2'-5' RNA ligase
VRWLAVNIALIPAAELFGAAITLNHALDNTSGSPIVLHPSDCLPHVSLAMGCVREDHVAAVANILDTPATAHPPVELIPTGFHVRTSQNGLVVASMELARTATLQALHEAVVRAVEPLVSYEVSADMFIEPNAIPLSTIRWVNEYVATASFERFWPHITLGMGTRPIDAALPVPALTSRLALCQLGPHGTCRRIVFETSLRGG